MDAPPRPASRALARGSRGVVATPHPLATVAGIDALRAGGNAVDAAVAANAVLAVVYNHACGLGGDAFALVWSPVEERLFAFNGSGRAPAAQTVELIRDRGHEEMPVRGGFSVTVPGAVDAWSQILGRFGRRTLADSLLPAAEIAERGHAVTDVSASAIAASQTLLMGDRGAAATFLPGGRPPEPGSLLRQPMLARTLRLLALDGPDAFYRGPVAREIVRAVGDAGGVMSLDDIGGHAGDWADPVRTTHREVEVCTTPPNSQGMTVLIALNVLAALTERGWPGLGGQDESRADEAPRGHARDAARLHAQVEGMKVAWAERNRLIGDPDRRPVNTAEVLSREYARRLALPLDPRRARPAAAAGSPAGDTVYLAVADGEGWFVSLIQSNYMGFGSGLMGGTTGVMLHNRGASFTLDDHHPNRLEPRARPLHTLMPGMLLRGGRPWAALGAMGGDGQPQTMLQLVTSLVDDGQNAQEAVERPRWVLEALQRGGPLATLTLEADAADAALVDDLRRLGHAVRLTAPRDSLMGWAQVVRREQAGTDVSLSGGADPRADSLALGF